MDRVENEYQCSKKRQKIIFTLEKMQENKISGNPAKGVQENICEMKSERICIPDGIIQSVRKSEKRAVIISTSKEKAVSFYPVNFRGQNCQVIPHKIVPQGRKIKDKRNEKNKEG